MTGRELRTCENCTPFPCPSDSDCTSTAALAGTGLVVPSGQAAEPPSGCTCAGAECTRGEFRDHQGDSPGCMACADLDPDQPCFAASGQAAELDGTEITGRQNLAARTEQPAPLTPVERMDRIRALSPRGTARLLAYLDGYVPEGVDEAFDVLEGLL